MAEQAVSAQFAAAPVRRGNVVEGSTELVGDQTAGPVAIVFAVAGNRIVQRTPPGEKHEIDRAAQLMDQQRPVMMRRSRRRRPPRQAGD